MFLYTECRLRPIIEKDLPLVFEWRNSERIRNSMFNYQAISLEEHIRWFQSIEMDELSRHFIFEYNYIPLGVVNFKQINLTNGTCYWGFYIGNPSALKGSGLVMGYIALDYIFEQFPIRKMCGEVLASNLHSIRFHKKLGFLQDGCLREHIFRNEGYESILCFSLFKKEWQISKTQLTQKLLG